MFPADPTVVGTLTSPDQLFDRLGTFWQNQLSDGEMLRRHMWATLQMHADVYLRAVELASAVSCQTVQPFAARQWRLIRLLESELLSEVNQIRYGDGRTYGDGSVYGQIRRFSHVWRLPVEIRSIGLLLDNPVDPKHVYDVSNCSFDATTSQLSFAVNPFDECVPLPVYDESGALVDRQILLFARNLAEDHHTPYLRFGSVVGLEGSGPTYVAVLRQLWSMLLEGPSIATIRRGALVSAGLQDTVGGETVEQVATDDEGRAIITDQRVYRAHADATVLVSAGDALQPGQSLVDTVQLYDLSTGIPRPYSDLRAIQLDRLIFANEDGVWQADTVDVRFTVYGNPTDIERFWADVHARGPTGATAGDAVNPMRYVIDNLIGANLLLVILRPGHYLAYQPGFIARLKGLIPAGTLLLVHTALPDTTDVLNLDGAGDTVTTSAAAAYIDDTASTLTLTHFTPFVMAS